MALRHFALVSTDNSVSASELSRVAAALQRQVLRDVYPTWGEMATVDAFTSLDDVPLSYWPMIVTNDVPEGAAGIHLDQDFTPFSLIRPSNRWTLTASHEALEMLIDPFGNRLQTAQSKIPAQGQVEYLVEVCDPSEAIPFTYLIDGVVVSDFYLPAYFNPVPHDRLVYSFTGGIKSPLEVLEGGYLSWRTPADSHWHQERWFGTAEPTFHDLGVFTGETESPRAFTDRGAMSVRTEAVDGVPEDSSDFTLLACAAALAFVDADAGRTQAERLQQHIDRLD